MYTYFYVCTWCSVHMCIVSISVIHICIWRQDLYVYVMCVYVWYILESGCQCRTLNFFFLYCFLSCYAMAASVTQPEGAHLCWPGRIHMLHPYPLPVLGLHAHAAMPSFLYDCCPYPYIGNTFTQWDISIPPYVHTVFSTQERANKLPHSYP